MAMSASRLRENIYRILDEVIESGEPVEIDRKGKLLRIVPVEAPKPPLAERIVKRPGLIVGDPEDLVHIDWSSEWNPDPL